MPLDQDTRTQLINTLERFVRERLIPLEAQVEEEDAVPEDVEEEMKAMGLYGLSLPEEYGGLGLGMVDDALVNLIFGRATPPFSTAFGTNIGIGAQGIAMDGTEEQKRKGIINKRLPSQPERVKVGGWSYSSVGFSKILGSVFCLSQNRSFS